MLQEEAKAIVKEYKRKSKRYPALRKAFTGPWRQMSFISEFSRMFVRGR